MTDGRPISRRGKVAPSADGTKFYSKRTGLPADYEAYGKEYLDLTADQIHDVRCYFDGTRLRLVHEIDASGVPKGGAESTYLRARDTYTSYEQLS